MKVTHWGEGQPFSRFILVCTHKELCGTEYCLQKLCVFQCLDQFPLPSIYYYSPFKNCLL